MRTSFVLAAAFAGLIAVDAAAQTYPVKPVKVILPFPVATGPDTVMRLVGERLTKIWGQQVIIENRPGGNGWIAMEAAKRAPTDGYTLLQADAPPMTTAPSLWKKLPYDPVKDFDPVAGLYRTYYYITVAADSKWNNVADLINAAKAKPGDVAYGSSGVGGNLHIGGAAMENATGVKMTHVPYKDTSQIYVAIGHGDIAWAVGSASTTLPMFKAKKIKYLAITGPKRSAILPDVPTVVEAGGPANYELQTWVALFAPHGTPKAIVSKINADVARVLQEPDLRERLAAMGFEPQIQSPEELQKVIATDSVKYGAIVKTMNISLD
jgi:tripartite-type tricarboxylate transporter receptor subunit TctC